MDLDLLTVFSIAYAFLVSVGLISYSVFVLIRTGNLTEAAQSCLRFGLLFVALGALFLPILTFVLQE